MKDYIKKINIERAEAEFEVTFKRNVIIIGFDVSMHSTGIAIIKITDNYLILDQVHKIIVPKNVDLLKGVDLFLDQINDFKRGISQKYKLDLNIIEDCFMGNNVKTLKSLARFSILVYNKFRGISTETRLVLPNTARHLIHFKKSDKSIKGTKLKKEIINYINDSIDTEIKDNDIADAIVLALSGAVVKE